MGCNSHLAIEYKVTYSHNNQSYWFVFGTNIAESMDYSLYAFMAGVRNYHEVAPIAEPRGVPKGASWEYRDMVEKAGSDGHSHSWLLVKEFRQAFNAAIGKYADYKPAKEWQAVRKCMEMLEELYGEDNVRLCFFFDN